MKFYVFSTLASDVQYMNYGKGGGDLPVPEGKGVFIKGGAGVANDRIVTPAGVRTEVTAEDLAYLNQNATFRLHVDNGYIKVEERKLDEEAAAGDMNANDESRQLTDGDFQTEADGGGDAAPTTGKSKKK